MSAVYTDNSVPYGSIIAVLSSAGTVVMENVTLTYPTKTIERSNQLGEPSGFVLVKGQPTGSATGQLATSSSTRPVNGETFTYTFAGTTAEKWVISSVGQPFEANGYYKVNLGLIQALF